MPQSDHAIPILSSVAPLVSAYDAWLCDVWGVMHNGVAPFPGAADACTRFRAQGGTVVMISNSPRPGHAVATQMTEIGVPEGTHDAIVTSGDTTRKVITERSGTPLFHLGPARDKPLLEGLDVQIAELPDAGFVLCSGLYDDLTETPDDYAGLLADMKARDLPMVCANPDIQVERGNRLIYCAGALAEAYLGLGGEVIYTGKPHKPIYEAAMSCVTQARGKDVAKDRILCIGDGVKTDMAGAAAADMDALYIASALHMGHSDDDRMDERRLVEIFADVSIKPVAAMQALTW